MCRSTGGVLLVCLETNILSRFKVVCANFLDVPKIRLRDEAGGEWLVLPYICFQTHDDVPVDS